MTKGARKGESLEMRSDGWKDNTRAEERTCLFRNRERKRMRRKRRRRRWRKKKRRKRRARERDREYERFTAGSVLHK